MTTKISSEVIENGAISNDQLAGSISQDKLAGAIPISKLSTTGSPSSSNFLRGDGSWQDNIYLETVYAVTGTTPQIAATNGSIQTWALSGNSTPTDGLNSGESVTLMIDNPSAYTITWTSLADEWIGDIAPDLTYIGYTVIELWKVGTTVYGAFVGDTKFSNT